MNGLITKRSTTTFLKEIVCKFLLKRNQTTISQARIIKQISGLATTQCHAVSTVVVQTARQLQGSRNQNENIGQYSVSQQPYTSLLNLNVTAQI